MNAFLLDLSAKKLATRIVTIMIAENIKGIANSTE